MDKKALAILLLLSLLIGIFGLPFHVSSVKARESSQFYNNLFEIQVALFNGTGADAQCVLAMTKLFEWMGCNVTTVQGGDIKSGYLDDFDVLAWPGGHYPGYWWEVGLLGRLEIQEFISDGGGYIGICGGAWWACDYMVWMGDPNYPPPEYKVEGDELNLDLFPGVARGPIEEITPFWTGTMTKINIVNHTHPITDSLPNYMQILYFGGPHLLPYEDADVTILGRYAVTGTPAIIGCEYGEGRVFLSGPHPDIEEDSDRDGWPPYPEWSDEGSDWPLLLQAMKWLTHIMETVFDVTWNDETYAVTVESKSTITDFDFSQPLKQINFKVTGPDGTTGFCNVTIPEDLLSASDEEWQIIVDDTQITDFIVTENATHTFLYFTYSHSTKPVRIIGTEVIEDGIEWFWIPIAVAVISIVVITAVLIARRRRLKLHACMKGYAVGF